MSERRFEISATVIRQLGEQLISDEVTALMELVKNAYDADASFVRIEVDTDRYYDEVLLSIDPAETGTRRQRPSEAAGYILIEDDGTGMDEGEIERGWLVISLSAKSEMKRLGKVTPKYQRTPLGDKGLGRLSAQRLGSRLDMYTVKEYLDESGQMGLFSNRQYRVSVDWNEFHESALLSNVPVFVDDSPRVASQTGTRLVITGLRNSAVWSDESSRRDLVAQLTQLISPFARTRPFRVFLSIGSTSYDFGRIADRVRGVAVSTHEFSWDGVSLTVEGKIKLAALRGNDSAEIYRHMLGSDQGDTFLRFLESRKQRIPGLRPEADGWFIGYATSRELSSIGGLEFRETTDGNQVMQLADPGPFSGELDQYVYDETRASALKDVFSKDATYRDYVRDHAGVRIYRDGFGVSPYGLDDNDWLRLGSGQTSGGSYYGLRPKNVIGYVAISARNNRQLVEKTDREGFSKDEVSRNFMRLMGEVVSSINQVFQLLRRDYNAYKRSRQEELTGILSPKQLFSTLRLTSAGARALEEPIADMGLERAVERIDSLLEHVQTEPYRAGAQAIALGDALQSARHELGSAQKILRQIADLQGRMQQLDHAADWIEQQFNTLQSQLHDFAELASLGLTAESVSHELATWADRLGRETKVLVRTLGNRRADTPEVKTYAAYVRSALTALRKQLSHLDPALRYAREEVNVISTQTFFHNAREYYLGLQQFQESGIMFSLEDPFEDFSFKMNRGKFTQVVDNLVLNSSYWLREAARRGDVENPAVTIAAKKPVVVIGDNGPGVDPAIEPVIFQPFVTTKPRGQGRGLGLYITQQLLDSVGCELSLLPDRNRNGRKYMFRIDLTGAIYGD